MFSPPDYSVLFCVGGARSPPGGEKGSGKGLRMKRGNRTLGHGKGEIMNEQVGFFRKLKENIPNQLVYLPG